MPPKVLRFLCGAVLALTAGSSSAQTSGTYSPKIAAQPAPMRVAVIDGSRFRDIETGDTYRLYGIDTCAPHQIARLDRQSWPCGTMAIAWLVTATLNNWLACTTLRDQADEHVVRCATAGHADIAADMLRDGVAVLSHDTDGPAIRTYGLAELDARKAYRGLWSSTFEMPSDWRADHNENPSASRQASGR
jgi:endonuclease YncB( thermonuclease family)